jgi:hypothetical protein
MRELRLSGAVALLSVWLSSVWFVACGPKVVVGAECAAACEENNAAGLMYFNAVANECVCSGCSPACSQSVCLKKETLSDACLPCVQESLRGDACNLHAGLFGTGCLGHNECIALVDCLTACPL